MRARSDNHPVSLDVQALYSVQALASIGNVSTRLLRRVLRANGVAFVRGGRALFVPLAEIQRKIPPLWESLHLAAELRQAISERPARPGSGRARGPHE